MNNDNGLHHVKLKKVMLEEGTKGHPYKVRVYFDNDTCWVTGFEEFSKVIEFLAISEDKKYLDKYKIPHKEIITFPSGKFLLGRNLFFLTWLYPIYDWYLKQFGFNPPEEHLKKAGVSK